MSLFAWICPTCGKQATHNSAYEMPAYCFAHDHTVKCERVPVQRIPDLDDPVLVEGRKRVMIKDCEDVHILNSIKLKVRHCTDVHLDGVQVAGIENVRIDVAVRIT